MRVIEVPATTDLSDFSAYLWHLKVPHRIFEERGQQILELMDAGLEAKVRSDYRAWREGKLHLTVERRPTPLSPILARLRATPAVVALLLLTVVRYPLISGLTGGQPSGLAMWLTIVDLKTLTSPAVTLGQVLGSGQPWRWLTPVFIHFSVYHLLFNCVAVYEFGRRVEQGSGPLMFITAVVVIGVISNLTQVLAIEYWNFGGLSGVAYGLLGFVLVRERMQPLMSCWKLPPGVKVSFLVFLLLLSTGVTELIGLNIANAAHWSGLISGGLLGFLTALTKASDER